MLFRSRGSIPCRIRDGVKQCIGFALLPTGYTVLNSGYLAVESISFGLMVPGRGYNIFVTGQPGSGRTSYALERLRERAAELPAPDDWLYLHNFDEPGEPLAMAVPAGRGKELCTALGGLLNELKTVIGKAFEQSQYEDAKAQYVKEFQEKAGAIMDELKAWAAEHRFSLKRTSLDRKSVV